MDNTLLGKQKRTPLLYRAISRRYAQKGAEKNYEFRKALATGKPADFDTETFAAVAAEWLKKRMAPKCAES